MSEDQFEIQKELLELTIKAGRRLMHDFDHMLKDVPDSCRWKKDYEERAKIWQSIFYADGGHKNYRSNLHIEMDSLETELKVAQNLLKKHGIDPKDIAPKKQDTPIK